MSHIAKIQLQIKDLDALAAAAESLGCELVRDKKNFLWYAGKRNPCDHVIRVKNAKAGTYEIGVIADGEGNFRLECDFWDSGGLLPIVGKDAQKLRQGYAESAATRQAQRQGFRVQRTVNENGVVRLRLTK